ncbi:F0F1 ATP synthase subunit A [Mycoplasmopsis citelli]|uniref:F-ATPase subunit 6 n=1 Tax=Mycoplasmopsis citelli TaxID=171281 RepID=A0A449B1L5_9BACT|nr:F0F1 ATP synthase subunit A [Mycoplasmopsis citelli]UUD35903.1 F0F1 ATP synthase subunit A [Mycoplasmopsis citelli]VEU74435.1 F-ATPase subunit 6 [Mycoplasmopsis citelli]
MNNIADKLWSWNQPQLLSLVVTVLVIFILSIIAYKSIKKVKPHQAPKGAALIAEMYLGGLDQMIDESIEDKLPKARHYIVTLFSMLLVGNLLSIFGLEPIGTSYSIPLTLCIATWLGIFVVGFIYQKLRYLKKYLNPFEAIGAIAPLISLGFRLYGNLIGGGVVLFLLYSLFGHLWEMLPNLSGHRWYFIAPVITPVFHFYFDIFDGLIQSYVFTILTLSYWMNEVGEEQAPHPLKNQTNNFKRVKISQKLKAIY